MRYRVSLRKGFRFFDSKVGYTNDARPCHAPSSSSTGYHKPSTRRSSYQTRHLQKVAAFLTSCVMRTGHVTNGNNPNHPAICIGRPASVARHYVQQFKVTPSIIQRAAGDDLAKTSELTPVLGENRPQPSNHGNLRPDLT